MDGRGSSTFPTSKFERIARQFDAALRAGLAAFCGAAAGAAAAVRLGSGIARQMEANEFEKNGE